MSSRNLSRSLRILAARRTLTTTTRQTAAVSVQTSAGPSTPPPPSPLSQAKSKAAKGEGTIASVFASLSGGSLEDALPPRFADLKRSLIRDEAHADALKEAWKDVLVSLKSKIEETIRLGAKTIPEVHYPSRLTAQRPIEQWMDGKTLEQIRDRGVVVIKGVIPRDQVLQWKEDIKEYAKRNSAKGFPEDNPQVIECYWTKAQLAARSHPSLLRASQAFLSLFHAPSQTGAAVVQPPELSVSLSNPLTYADRLRIRQPGDAKFALGPHIDGGGVERWECDKFRGVFDRVLVGGNNWRDHDPWSLGPGAERLGAQTDMYGGPGQCGVFRPLQGWLSMSSTQANEGTLRVLPFLRESTAYIMLRPFFQPKDKSAKDYLALDNWQFDADSAKFPGCSLGHNIELSTVTHPHLHLDKTMTSIPKVEPGDMVFWHCDGVHSVEAQHRGKGDSSVMYIPAIPATKVNFDYVREQRKCFEQGIPPQDFPGGVGESRFTGRGRPDDVQGAMARRAMGFEPLQITDDMPEAEKGLLNYCNQHI